VDKEYLKKEGLTPNTWDAEAEEYIKNIPG